MASKEFLSVSCIVALLAHVIFKKADFSHLKYPAIILSTFPWIILGISFQLGFTNIEFGSVKSAHLSFYALSSFSIVLYRLSPWHPLASYPGPTFAKITKLWGLRVAYRGKLYDVLQKLHEKHGPFVRIGPNEISIAESEAVIAVLGANGLPKGKEYLSRKNPNAPPNILVLHGDEHANRRRLWNRGMSSESLLEYEGMIARRAEQLVRAIARIKGPFDIAQWLTFFSFDFLGDMAFGGGFEMLQDGGDKSGIWKLMDGSLAVYALLSNVSWASRTFSNIPFVAARMFKLRAFGIGRATERLKNGSSKKDLWYHLMDEAGLEKEPPPLANVIADGALAIVAGADTTARALTSLLFFLMDNPRYYKRVVEEMRNVFPDGESVLDTSKYKDLIFLEACINETLRVHPPIPCGGPRRVPDDGDGRSICGKYFSAGTEVLVAPYVLHHDTRYFSPRTEEFWPERWLPETVNNTTNSTFRHHVDAFIPFSFGPANCVGRNLARMEIRMLVLLILSKFDLDLAPGFDKKEWISSFCDHFIMRAKKPLTVVLAPRLV